MQERRKEGRKKEGRKEGWKEGREGGKREGGRKTMNPRLPSKYNQSMALLSLHVLH